MSLFKTKQNPLCYSPRPVYSFSCLLSVRLEIIPQDWAHEEQGLISLLCQELDHDALGQHCRGNEALFFLSCVSEAGHRSAGEPELRRGSQAESKGFRAWARPMESHEDN